MSYTYKPQVADHFTLFLYCSHEIVQDYLRLPFSFLQYTNINFYKFNVFRVTAAEYASSDETQIQGYFPGTFHIKRQQYNASRFRCLQTVRHHLCFSTVVIIYLLYYTMARSTRVALSN